MSSSRRNIEFQWRYIVYWRRLKRTEHRNVFRMRLIYFNYFIMKNYDNDNSQLDSYWLKFRQVLMIFILYGSFVLASIYLIEEISFPGTYLN